MGFRQGSGIRQDPSMCRALDSAEQAPECLGKRRWSPLCQGCLGRLGGRKLRGAKRHIQPRRHLRHPTFGFSGLFVPRSLLYLITGIAQHIQVAFDGPPSNTMSGPEPGHISVVWRREIVHQRE